MVYSGILIPNTINIMPRPVNKSAITALAHRSQPLHGFSQRAKNYLPAALEHVAIHRQLPLNLV